MMSMKASGRNFWRSSKEGSMKLTRKTTLNILALILLVVLAFIYTAPHSFSEIMPGLDESPIVKCEAEYYAQETGENGKPKYITTYKEFDVSGEDYALLMEQLDSVGYRKKLAFALTGGKNRSGYSIDYPYAIISFYADEHVYQYCLFGRSLAAGAAWDKLDYTPQGGADFQETVMEFIRTHGTVVDEEIRQY